MQVVLVMFRSDGETRSFSVTRDVTILGRREDCDLRIPLSDVSRKHCRFLRDGDVIRVEDLGSANGTYHNGQRVQEAELAPGDTIQVGPVMFCIQIDGLPAEEDMSPMLPTAAGSPHGESADAAIEEAGMPPEELHAAEGDELAAADELTVDEDPPALEPELGDEDHSAQAELLSEPAGIEEPLEVETPPAPRPAAPPPPIPLEMGDDQIIEQDVPASEEVLEEGQADLLEDFEIIEEEDTGGQDGDMTVDTEEK